MAWISAVICDSGLGSALHMDDGEATCYHTAYEQHTLAALQPLRVRQRSSAPSPPHLRRWQRRAPAFAGVTATASLCNKGIALQIVHQHAHTLHLRHDFGHVLDEAGVGCHHHRDAIRNRWLKHFRWVNAPLVDDAVATMVGCC